VQVLLSIAEKLDEGTQEQMSSEVVWRLHLPATGDIRQVLQAAGYYTPHVHAKLRRTDGA
jgi:POTRA domain TamA domain 1